MRKNIREIAFYGVLSAILFVLALVPNIGMIQVGPVSITIMHIPVIIAALLFGVKGGLLMGVLFGVLSWFLALTRAATPIDLWFQNPLVAILPRAAFGGFAGLMAGAFKKLANKQPELEGVIVGALSSLFHSVLVLAVLILVAYDLLGSPDSAAKILAIIFSVNVLAEAVGAGLVCGAVNRALRKIMEN